MRRWRWVWVAGVVSLLTTSGCYAHVALQAPPASAPLSTRIRAYNRLKPVAANMVQLVNQNGFVGAPTVTLVRLADGQEVHYPEDLLPVVAPKSNCALAIKRYLPAAHTSKTLYWVGLGGVTVGGLLPIAGLLSANPDQIGTTGLGPAFTTTLIVGSVLMVGGLISYLAGAVFGAHAQEEAQAAFALYGDGLQKRLQLQVRSPPPVQQAPPVGTTPL